MGNQCTGKSKPKKNIQQQQENISPINQSSPQSLKATTDNGQTNNTNQNTREGTTTSYQDIRKIYKFQPDIIGHGQFGAVRLANLLRDPNKQFAVKTISKQKLKQDLQLLRVELEIMKNLDHPNIIKFYETYQDQNFFHLVIEYCSGGELFERIVEKQHFSEKETISLLHKIFSAVNYLHMHGIVHRDLKPENFLFKSKEEDCEIKIIDFGLSQALDFCESQQKKLKDIVGTALYIAPEVLQGSYDYSCDMWSLGVITYILLSGNPPFRGKNNQEIFDRVKEGKVQYPSSDWRKISKNGKDFVQKLLETDVSKRMTSTEALNHPWLKQKLPETKEDKAPIDPQIVNIMKNFRSAGKFKREVLKVMVNQLNEKELRNLRAQFRKFDTNLTGTISLNELRQGINKVGHNDTDQEIQNMLKTFTLDPSQKTISYSTFIGACLDKNNFLTDERLYTTFKQFDIDNTDAITLDNLKEVMARSGRKLEDSELRNFISDFDLTNDQIISWEEFHRMMTMDKDEDLQSVRESMIQERKGMNTTNQSFGQIGIEVSNGNSSFMNNQNFRNLDYGEVEIQVVMDRQNNQSRSYSNSKSNQEENAKKISSNIYQSPQVQKGSDGQYSDAYAKKYISNPEIQPQLNLYKNASHQANLIYGRKENNPEEPNNNLGIEKNMVSVNQSKVDEDNSFWQRDIDECPAIAVKE